MEEFVLTEDRTRFLAQLVPGTEDYYYYHSLHYQHTGEFSRIDELLRLWLERHGRTSRYEEIRNRQALLTYPDNPKASLEYLKETLHLHFDHQREVEHRKTRYPTELDARYIRRETLADEAFRQTRDLSRFNDTALYWLLDEKPDPARLDASRRRLLLQRVRWPDHPRLVQHVLEDLNAPNSSGFGSLPIHSLLLLEQLEQLKRKMPALGEHTAFVHAYLRKLQPGPDVDWEYDVGARQEYLNTLRRFVEPLSAAFNSLKAHVLLNLLQHERSQGRYPRETFLAYLKLPRQSAHINPDFMTHHADRHHPVNLRQDFRNLTRLPPVADDQALIDAYLAHYFVKEQDYRPFAAYLREDYLKRVFATTKILGGVGDMEAWYSMLDDPGYYQRLKDRVDIDFAPANKVVFAADEAVSLELEIKNVEMLVVKVYEINTLNYYLAQGREVDTSIDLDGLVAREEETFHYQEPPLRRVRRTFSFESLKQPGLYVIEFIGNGKSSRALIRKGRLRYLERIGAAGHVFTVLDERGELLPEATLWMEGREFKPNKHGQIVVPFASPPAQRTILLRHGRLTTLDSFMHREESYHFQAGIWVDRESLLKGNKAQVLVRPTLTLHGSPASLALVEAPRLVIESTDRQGVSTSAEVSDFRLYADRESVHTFQVPDNLARISFTVKGRVKQLTRNDELEVSAYRQYEVNAMDGTARIRTLHLARTDKGYLLELLGKTGEAHAAVPVRVSLSFRDFTQASRFVLQTDDSGRIRLGALEGVVVVSATTPEGVEERWELAEDRCSTPRVIQSAVGEPILVPYMGSKRVKEACSLLELRGDTYLRALDDGISIKDGYLYISGLEGGDYRLWLKEEDLTIDLRVAPGKRVGRWCFSTTRMLETAFVDPIQIQELTANRKEVRVRVSKTSEATRVHVVGTRFLPAHSIWTDLAGQTAIRLRQVPVAQNTARYLSGRDIGDEYRYILERRYTKKYPGNMLPRPGLLLNPWAMRKTSTDLAGLAAGSEYGACPEAPCMSAAPAPCPPSQPQGQGGTFANPDFLAHSAVVMTNLRPDPKGVIVIPRESLAHVSQVRVMAIDPGGAVVRELPLQEISSPHKDLRLYPGLETSGHFSEKKQISLLFAEDTLTIEDLSTSQLELYDSLARVYGLYSTLTNNANLERFGFILTWPELDEEKRREYYSEFACHELNFFLSRRDPAYFDRVVSPALRNKKDKTFMDHYLVGDELSRYLEPWAFGRLNIVERILLAGRHPGERQRVSRHAGDLCELLPPDVEGDNRLFSTALQGRALETGDALGIGAARETAREVKKKARRSISTETPALARGAGLASRSAMPAMRSELAKESKLMDAMPAEEAEEAACLSVMDAEMDMGAREEVRQFYQKLDTTQEWGENNYYRLTVEEQGPELIKINAFWRDFARHESGPFLSQHFMKATGNFSEMMLALSVLDLPFKPGQHGVTFEGAGMRLRAAGPLVAFHKEIAEVVEADEQLPILVSQNYFREDDRYRYEEGERLDKYVQDELLARTAYLCQVVLTNPTSSRQKLDLLLQIPEGALPLNSGFFTRSTHIRLEPYAAQTLEYMFYFPHPGSYPHFSVHVSRNEALIASAPPRRLEVVEALTNVDRSAWSWVSQYGSSEDVLEYLRDANIERLDLEKIAWRMRDEKFYDQALTLLEARHVYEHTLWSYSLRHQDLPRLRQFLLHGDSFLRGCGLRLESPLVDIDPVQRGWYQHLEYAPLVNARAHPLGGRFKILNDRFAAQYRQFLNLLGYQPRLDDETRLAFAYYLLLQDRIEEAIEMFSTIDRERVVPQLQYDYLRSYLHFYRNEPQQAREVALPYQEYPLNRWRNLFRAVVAQVEEAEGASAQTVDDKDRTQRQTELAATQPGFEFTVENRAVTLHYRNLAGCTVHYYRMDIELLFSRQPFVQEQSDRFSYITPNRSDGIILPADGNVFTFALPDEFQSANIIVEVVAEGVRRSQAYYAHQLLVQVVEPYGQISVLHAGTGRPLGGTYVKVYARMRGGEVSFYKDGYTDLRGRYDYTSLSTDELERVERFSLLILNEDHGAVIREAAPPAR